MSGPHVANCGAVNRCPYTCRLPEQSSIQRQATQPGDALVSLVDETLSILDSNHAGLCKPTIDHTQARWIDAKTKIDRWIIDESIER